MKKIVSTMTGSVFQVHVKAGDEVQPGQDVVILESMKMEIPVTAEQGGTVKEVKVDVGDFVNEGDVVVVLE
ncbi:acetyl-CoA carboxylase biotin carboxyl carrier protein [Caldalkalibacillus uzonensis]|uniref:Acetyl-CoA carboxylase biotin carboxyl carrier protein n=1 Tax=Caldalkalibacillus uzonensis TaxID=353224 RepID=A0ABU0CSV0_9BACI|nr:acetyl-CoA carboxylase biotin carboxyl carrier protein subunit [Caldalkalibacillus uzonensis]MDQ0339207.1 acetyl-CoA carboxylase biotin carboxyl carrier protein [Caldalkalibacillus uzonensis]